MRLFAPTHTIAGIVVALAFFFGLVTHAIADDPPPEPVPPDDTTQLLQLPDVQDDIGAYLHLPPPQMLGEVRQLSASDRQACVLLYSGLAYCFPLRDDATHFAHPPHDLYAAIAVGLDHACAIDQASRPLCWGDNSRGQLDVPNEIFIDIAAGDHHTCGLDVAGEIHCWGQLDAAHRSPPSGPFDKIAAGGDRTCASGPWEPSRCFGAQPVADQPFDEYVRQIETSSGIICARDLSNRPICKLEPALRDFEPPSPLAADIAVGSGFMCTLEPSGAIRCEGPDTPDLPASLPISRTIDAGENTLCAVTAWRELQCWGDDGPIYTQE